MSARKKAVAEATCRRCGCTDSRACKGGCSWVLVDRAQGTGLCSACATTRVVPGTWRPSSEIPTAPTSALIASCLEKGGMDVYLETELYEFDPKRGGWFSVAEGEPLQSEPFMWMAETEVLPEDLFTRCGA